MTDDRSEAMREADQSALSYLAGSGSAPASKPLTIHDLREAMDTMQRRADEEAMRRADRAYAFWSSLPDGFVEWLAKRGGDDMWFVHAYGTAVTTGTIVHPRTAEDAQRLLAFLLDEYACQSS